MDESQLEKGKPRLFLYLDIDGVFITPASLGMSTSYTAKRETFDPGAVRNFNHFLFWASVRFDILPVISSSWRKVRPVQEIASIFIRNGVNLPDEMPKWTKTDHGGPMRGDEIARHLASRGFDAKRDAYLVFDDDSDMDGLNMVVGTGKDDAFVHTRHRNGFSDENVLESLHKLRLQHGRFIDSN